MNATGKCRFLLLGLLGFTAWTGCTSPGFSPLKTASLTTSSDSEPAASMQPQGELPPKQKALACFVTAEELQKSGHAEQAILLYEKARSNDPSLKSVAHHLAVLYDAQGDSVRALSEFNKALESDPKDPSLLSDLGYYYFERGNLVEADRSLRQALAIDPNYPKALCNLALVLAAEGRLDESFQAFSKVVGPAAAHSNLGVLLAKQGRYDQARQAFHQALALDATLPQPKAFLAYLDRQQSVP